MDYAPLRIVVQRKLTVSRSMIDKSPNSAKHYTIIYKKNNNKQVSNFDDKKSRIHTQFVTKSEIGIHLPL